MFKKLSILLFIFSLLFCFNVNSCKAETIDDINISGEELTEQIIDKVFSIDFLSEIKKVWDENFSIYYSWFKTNIQPKITNALEKVTATEEYAKEKEELKSEFPSIIEKLINIFQKTTTDEVIEEE